MSEQTKLPQETPEILLKRLEYEYALAQTGLKGTLIASVVTLVTVIIVVTVAVVAPIVAGREKEILTGDQMLYILITLLVIVGVCVFLYGTFVFRRLAGIDLDLKNWVARFVSGDKA